MDTKTCKTCKVEKSVNEFGPNKGYAGGRLPHCRPCMAAKAREHYQRNRERVNEYKKAQMKAYRRDPEKNEKIKANRRRYWRESDASEKQKGHLASLRSNHFFLWRARLWSARHSVTVTGLELWRLWKTQKGRCALSGRKLSAHAHLDHIVPVSNDGAHTIENLRWLDPLVNVARGNLTDAEFVSLCRDVVAAVESLEAA